MSFVGDWISGSIGDAITGGSDDKAEKVLNPRILGFNAGGMTYRKNGDIVTLRADKQNRAAVKGAQKAWGSAGAQFANLAKKIAPGYGLLTKALVKEIDTRRRSARSDLRDMFARRRLSGSSFAADTLSRNEAEFADLEKKARAEAFVQEMELTSQNIKDMATARSNAYSVLLNQLNLEARMGAELATSGAQVIAGMSEAQARMFGESADRLQAWYEPAANSTGEYAGSLLSWGAGGGQGGFPKP